MTDSDAGTTSGTSRTELSEAGTTKFTWVCPICGASATRIAPSERADAVARNALRSHVRVSTGDGHGPAHGYPPELDPDAIDASVELTDV